MSNELTWFRAYGEMVDNDRLKLLAFEDRWHYVALLCCKTQGILDEKQTPELLRRRIAVKLGLQLREVEEVARRLEEVGLLNAKTLQPIGWNKRQFKSDSSAERTRKWRKRKNNQNVTVTEPASHGDGSYAKNDHSNVSDNIEESKCVTSPTRHSDPPDTETESETETETYILPKTTSSRDLVTEHVLEPCGDAGGEAQDPFCLTGDDPAEAREKAMLAACNAALHLWNEFAEDCERPRAVALTDMRRDRLQARIIEHKMDGFRRAIANARASPFLRREMRGFGLDWLIRPNNFIKVLEGVYNGPPRSAAHRIISDAAEQPDDVGREYDDEAALG